MTASADRECRVTRVIPAPLEAVFRAWTEPELIRQWSCPPGATIRDSQVDLVPGGPYRLLIEAEAGTQHTAFGVYREVDAPNRLVYTWDWEEPESAVGETLVTVEFIADGASTEVVVAHEGFPAAEAAEGHRLGWTWSLERLEGLFR
ncbi:SRPBCC domain-containing protein [Candidatus Palauibacter soopunensis]|uniref:SRPBCC family protein n=1 Tax=Candidatus Palauibacter soopunensis TaxID=3056739 RepID=UPI00239E8ECF|nr:SRPBCC domain-containing protein [Candidatus Palauibacter soopunensis]MDE2878132.1 SRPBCC domain-containing protein [Candidatus Palauibacter soopunensis]